MAATYEPLRGSERLTRRAKLAGCLFAVLAVALVAAASFAARDHRNTTAPAEGDNTFLSLGEKKPTGRGGCKWGVHCDKVPCCTEAGYSCIRKTQWWSACELEEEEPAPGAPAAVAAPATAAPPPPPPPPAAPAPAPTTVAGTTVPAGSVAATTAPPEAPAAPASCSKPGSDCTHSLCCTGSGYACKKRTDGMWWKSTCVESDGEKDAGTAAKAPAVASVADITQEGSILHADSCGKDIPDIGNVTQKWEVAELCAKKLLAKMSVDDKVGLLHGHGGGMGYAGFIKFAGVVGTQGTVRLTFNDGPQGYNGYAEPTWSKATQFPDLIALAATFDVDSASNFGAAIAEEFRTKGCAVLLGPDVEVARVPRSGRTFESLSGEDPYLGRELARAYVREVQSRGVISTVKHWLNNNQELDRQELDVDVSDRAQHEIYTQPFRGAIEAGAGAVMCSYNKVYGHYACENHKLLRELLRDSLGFRGFVVSDWGATHSGTTAAHSGLDVQMPDDKFFGGLGAQLQPQEVDELAGRVIASVYAAGQFHGRGPPMQWSWPPPYYQDSGNGQHELVARNTIIESTVLLKNDRKTLPFKAEGTKFALVGEVCRSEHVEGAGSAYSAGGSGYVATTRVVTPLDGFRQLLGDDAVSWSADGAGAGSADAVVICASVHVEEGKDRPDLTLPQAQELISAVKKQPGVKRIVMLAIVPGAITTEWIGDVDAALVMFMPGEQVGAALARLLTGEVAPGGRLPMSFPRVGEQRFSPEQYPGVNKLSRFAEGVLVGYRWNDAKRVPSAFPFGYGLSYTDFVFSDFAARCDGHTASVTLSVRNAGQRAGAAVPQLYVGFEGLAPVVRQLRGFRKVHLPIGSSANVTFKLSTEDWSFYDEAAGKWMSALDLHQGVTVSIGTSSADLVWSSILPC